MAKRLLITVLALSCMLTSVHFSSWPEEQLGPFGGVSISSLSAEAEGPNHLDVFALGRDQYNNPDLWHLGSDGSNWGGPPEYLGSFGDKSLSAVSWGPNRLDVF